MRLWPAIGAIILATALLAQAVDMPKPITSGDPNKYMGPASAKLTNDTRSLPPGDGSAVAIRVAGDRIGYSMTMSNLDIPKFKLKQPFVSAENTDPEHYTHEGSLGAMIRTCSNLPTLARGSKDSNNIMEVVNLCTLAAELPIGFDGQVLPANAAGAFFWDEAHHAALGISMDPRMQEQVCQGVLRNMNVPAVRNAAWDNRYFVLGDRYCSGVFVHEIRHYSDFKQGKLKANDVEGNEARAIASECAWYSISLAKDEISWVLTNFGPRSKLNPSDYTVKFMIHMGDVLQTECQDEKIRQLVRRDYKIPSSWASASSS